MFYLNYMVTTVRKFLNMFLEVLVNLVVVKLNRLNYFGMQRQKNKILKKRNYVMNPSLNQRLLEIVHIKRWGCPQAGLRGKAGLREKQQCFLAVFTVFATTKELIKLTSMLLM